MSDYKMPSLDTFSQRSDLGGPIRLNDYRALNRVGHNNRNQSPSNQQPEKVEISSAAGRQSMLSALKAKYGYSSVNASLLSGLIPPASSGFSSGLYAGVGQLSSSQVQSLINGYV